jgi:hypothetical protein
MVCSLQTAQRRMVGQRTVQLRLVRAFLRALPFLVPLARPADARSWKSEVRSQKSFGCSDHRPGRAFFAAAGATV